MDMRPTFFSLLFVLILLIAPPASATNAGPGLPAPVANTMAKPTDERGRVMEILFEASCVRKHISKAYQSKAEIHRLLLKHGFDEKRIEQLAQRYLRMKDFKAELKRRKSQCTSTLARTLYTSS